MRFLEPTVDLEDIEKKYHDIVSEEGTTERDRNTTSADKTKKKLKKSKGK